METNLEENKTSTKCEHCSMELSSKEYYSHSHYTTCIKSLANQIQYLQQELLALKAKFNEKQTLSR